jgi:hypothetical protein
VLNIFKKKKKQEEKQPKILGDDSFQATAEPALSETPATPLPGPSIKEVIQYKNEILLRGKIGMSTGSSAAEKPEKKSEKEEKKTEKPIEDSHADKIDSEHAQVMKINLNKKLENQE